MPSFVSSARIEWLSADGETPNRAAALAKLPDAAISENTESPAQMSLSIHEFRSATHAAIST